MTHEQRADHIAQLLTYRSDLECKLAQVNQEIAELKSRQAVESSTQVRRDAVGQALLEQRATMSGYDVVADACRAVETYEGKR